MNIEEHLNKNIVYNDTKLSDIVRIINTNESRTICVIDKDFNLIGTISDGDIRRAFLSGFSLDEPCGKFANADCYYENLGSSDSNSAETRTKYRLIPITKNRKVVGLKIYQALSNDINTALIMAGGFGTRMGSLTEKTPKPMLMVNETPILELIIRSLRKQKIENIYISVYYLAEKIKNYFGDGRDFGLNISYLHEDQPLGTGGCLSLISDVCDLVVLNGDILSNIDIQNFARFCLDRKSDIGLVIKNYEMQNPFGVVTTNGFEFTGFEEKPIYSSAINAGIYFISKEVLNQIPDRKFDMPELLTNCKNDGRKVVVYPYEDDFWIDVGNPTQLSRAENLLRDKSI